MSGTEDRVSGATGTDGSVGVAAGLLTPTRGRRSGQGDTGEPSLAHVVVAWFLAIGALGLLVLHLLLPLPRTTTTTTWAPTSPNDDSAPLVLSGSTPASLTAVVPCPRPDWFESSVSQVAVLSTSADPALRMLSLVADPQGVWVRISGQDLPGLRIDWPGDATPCTMRVTYERTGNVLTLSVGERQVSGPATWIDPYDARVRLDGIQVTGLHAASSAIPGISVTVVTQPAGVVAPAVRYLPVSAAGLLGAAALVSLLVRRRRRRRDSHERSGSSLRRGPWGGVDWLVLALLVIGWLIVPTLYDDGWVLTTVREFPNLHYFSDYFANEATPQPLGFWWDLVQSAWMRMTGLSALVLRLPSVLIGVVTWWVLRYRVLGTAESRGESRSILWPAAVVFATGWSVWLITLRPEPLVALLLVAQFAITARIARSPDLVAILMSGLTSVLALTAHQTGVAVLTASLAAAPSAIAWWRSRASTRTKFAVVAGMAGLAAILGVLLSAWGNLAAWLASRQAFQDGLGHDNLLDEVARIASLNGFYVTPLRRLTVALLLIGSVAFLVSLRRQPRSNVVIGAAALLATSGLALTVSKWPWHYGVVMPAAAVLAGLTGGWMWSTRRETGLTWRVTALGLAAAAGGYWSAQSTQPWTESSLARGQVTDLARPGTSGPLELGTLGFWAIAALVTVVGGLAVARARGRSTGLLSGLAAFVILTLATTTVISFRPLVQDATAAGAMSWIGQSTTALGGDSCGLASPAGYRVPVATTPLVVRSGPALGAQPAVPQDPAAVDAANPPMSAAARYVTPPEVPPSGLVATPWHQLDPGVPGRLWVRTDRGGILTGVVESVDLAGGDWRGLPFSAPLELPGWRLIELPGDGETRLVRVAWRPSQSNLVVATGAVAVSRSEALSDLTSVAWVNPSTYLQAPCLQPPSIRNGVVESFTWSNGFPAILGRSYAFEGTVSEMACTSALPTPERLCAVQVRTPDSAALATFENTVVQ